MGLHLSSVNGLRAASGYELFILSYGLDPGSPEYRAFQANFSYIAEMLGTNGLVITGSFDKAFGANFAGYLEEIEGRLFSTAMLVKRLPREPLPVPALIALWKSPDKSPEMAYLNIRDKDEVYIVGACRNIAEAGAVGDLSLIRDNLLAPRAPGTNALWEAVQLRPSFWGVGIDIKVLLDRLAPR